MSANTWTQYVAMDDARPEPGFLQAALDSLEDWDDDFDLGDVEAGPGLDDFEDIE